MFDSLHVFGLSKTSRHLSVSAPGDGWIAALPLPLVTGGNNVVSNAATGEQKLYRLFKS